VPWVHTYSAWVVCCRLRRWHPSWTHQQSGDQLHMHLHACTMPKCQGPNLDWGQPGRCVYSEFALCTRNQERR
jgi:hypothetical protein